jgi:hypothetical protein
MIRKGQACQCAPGGMAIPLEDFKVHIAGPSKLSRDAGG